MKALFPFFFFENDILRKKLRFFLAYLTSIIIKKITVCNADKGLDENGGIF